MASNGVVVFHFPSVYVLMSISAAYVTIGSYIGACQPITHLLQFTREDTLKKNIGDFYRSATMKKFSTVIACKRNRFDFWKSCKRLQNFVNVEALVLGAHTFTCN